MLRSMTAFSLVLVGAMAVQAADPRAEDYDVQHWIAQLDNEKFAVREEATTELITAYFQTAIEAVARTAEAGSPEARTRALHILSVWHRLDETSREAVKATATRWQATKNAQVIRLGKQLAAKTKPRPAQTTVQVSDWGGGVAIGLLLR